MCGSWRCDGSFVFFCVVYVVSFVVVVDFVSVFCGVFCDEFFYGGSECIIIDVIFVVVLGRNEDVELLRNKEIIENNQECDVIDIKVENVERVVVKFVESII